MSEERAKYKTELDDAKDIINQSVNQSEKSINDTISELKKIKNASLYEAQKKIIQSAIELQEISLQLIKI